MSEARRACLGMPGYGEMTAGAGRGLWRASKGAQAKIPLDVAVQYQEGSLLAQNFNALWCWPLNECHQGRSVHYFAMLHADIEPEDGWLDKLIEEVEAKELDVLGAVMPIKDPKGLTSLALAREDGDNWLPLCRLTMREVFQLPETFTSKDVGHPLLLNTGCWVCRFDPEWAKQVHFTINDRIVFNTALNMYQAQVEPEDWFFSRLLHEMGLKVGATRKVKADHVGKARYVNYAPWGSESFDAQYVAKGVLPPSPDGWKFPDDVKGWLSFDEGKALADLARGKRVLEVGSYCGRSTVCMAQTAELVHSVDPHDGRATPKPQETLKILKGNLERYGLTNVITSACAFGDYSMYEGAPFDLVFIDGAHDLESVRSDIRQAVGLLKPDGILAFHDYREHPGQHDGRWDAGVTQAVGELVHGGGEILSVHSTLAAVKPPSLLESTHG